jgi:hypothetical protein
MHGKSLGAAIAVAAAACSPHSGQNHGSEAAGSAGPTVTIFALAELRGQIEPCGCTTDPLGDLARTVELVQNTRSRGPALVVDAGSTLFDVAKVPPHRADQATLKADLIVKTFTERLQVAAWGLGPSDLGMGPQAVRPPRQAVNVAASAGVALEPPKVIDAGGSKIGVFGVIAPDAIDGVPANDPGPAATAAAADLRAKGAQVVIALVQARSKRDAVALVRSAKGVDLAIAGLGALAPEPDKMDARAEQVGDAWLVIPANRGQVVAKIELTLRPGSAPLLDAIGPAAAEAERAKLGGEATSLANDLAGFEKDPTADKAFVAQKKQELAELRARIDALAKDPTRAPATGSYFTLAMVRISKKLACDAAVQTAKSDYAKAAGTANVKAAAARPPIPVPPGKATYVGAEACGDCHGAAVDFWSKTRHAHAFATLEQSGKQLDYECIGCHVTGWDEPGGSTMAKNDALRNVQCEACHGPGSIHVDKEGQEKPLAIVAQPPHDLCADRCHTPQHSDTFQRDAYLRDILGPGHGEKARAALGDGPTGHELRAAGLAKAGAEIGAGCTK